MCLVSARKESKARQQKSDLITTYAGDRWRLTGEDATGGRQAKPNNKSFFKILKMEANLTRLGKEFQDLNLKN